MSNKINFMVPFVSVIIPTLNREESLRNVLNYFLKSEKYPTFEIIVIDQSDKHEPETINFLSTIISRIRYFQVKYKSLPRARNEGVCSACGEIVIFVDDDVEPRIGFISAHVAPYHDPPIMMVTGPTLDPGQKLKTQSEIGEKEYNNLLAHKKFRFDVDFGFYTSWAPGCNFSCRKNIVDQVGGFDENFIGSAVGEEAEFCHRIKKGGGLIYYTPYAYVVHKKVAMGGCRDLIKSEKYLYAIAYNTNYFWFKIGVSSIYRYKIVCKVFIDCVVNHLFKTSGKFFYLCVNFIKGFMASEKLIHKIPKLLI